MSAKPAEKFVSPIARVRSVGGYWNEVNAGIIAFATPVVLLPNKISKYYIKRTKPILNDNTNLASIG